MRSIVVAAALCAVSGAQVTWAQTPEECVPSALNIAEAKYPCLYSDNRALFRVVAPDAQKVRVRIGPGFDMTKGPDGIWSVTDHAARRRLPLLHAADRRRRGRGSVDAHLLRIRLAEQRHRSAGTRRRVLPAPGCAARPREPAVVPLEGHGHSGVARLSTRRPITTAPRRKSYPVLYLLHGWGEDETGWYRQGHVDDHPRQPDRGKESDADDRRDGQPERGEARRERDAVRGAGPGAAAVRHAARAAVTRHTAGARRPRSRPRRGGPRPRRSARPSHLHRDDVHRPRADDRAHLSRAPRQGESRHGGVVDGRRADVRDDVDEPGQVRLHRRLQRQLRRLRARQRRAGHEDDLRRRVRRTGGVQRQGQGALPRRSARPKAPARRPSATR